MKLAELEQAFLVTEKTATPHRIPDFKFIRSQMVDPNEQLGTSLMFIEEHNTGYNGILERWFVTFQDKEDKSILFQIDLLPGMIKYVE
jgi:hypothetical protein